MSASVSGDRSINEEHLRVSVLAFFIFGNGKSIDSVEIDPGFKSIPHGICMLYNFPQTPR